MVNFFGIDNSTSNAISWHSAREDYSFRNSSTIFSASTFLADTSSGNEEIAPILHDVVQGKVDKPNVHLLWIIYKLFAEMVNRWVSSEIILLVEINAIEQNVLFFKLSVACKKGSTAPYN